MNAATQPTATQRPRRRRRYVINPHFQWKFAGWLMTVVFTASLAMGFVLLYLLETQVRAQVLNTAAAATVGSPMATLIGFGIACTVVTTITFGVWSLVLTHRFCGPLYVIGGYLKELRAGKYPKARDLRRKDEFKEFYAEFRQTLDVLRERRESEVAVLERALEMLRSNSAPAGDANTVQQLATEMEQLRDELAAALDGSASRAEPGFVEQAEPQSSAHVNA